MTPTAGMAPDRLRGIVAATLYIVILGFGYGMFYPLLTVILEADGVSGTLIGLSGTVQAVGSVLITPILPRVLRRFGLANLLAGAALCETVLYLLVFLTGDVWLWMPLRLLLGACGSVAFFGSEYWIVAMAPERRRGQVVGVYTILVTAAMGAGPMLLPVIGFVGFLPFAIPLLLSALGTVPVLLARHRAPRFTGSRSLASVPRFMLQNPGLCLAVVLFGMLEAGLLTLLPAWGVRAGISAEAAVVLIGLAGFGTVAIQPLIGPAADRWNRRRLLAFCAAASALLMLAMPPLVGQYWALASVVFLWGGIAAGLYTVALVELGSRYRGGEMAVGNAAIILGYSLGATAGPLFAGGMMDAIPPHGMLYSLVAGCLFYLALLAFRSVGDRRRDN